MIICIKTIYAYYQNRYFKIRFNLYLLAIIRGKYCRYKITTQFYAHYYKLKTTKYAMYQYLSIINIIY